MGRAYPGSMCSNIDVLVMYSPKVRGEGYKSALIDGSYDGESGGL